VLSADAATSVGPSTHRGAEFRAPADRTDYCRPDKDVLDVVYGGRLLPAIPHEAMGAVNSWSPSATRFSAHGGS